MRGTANARWRARACLTVVGALLLAACVVDQFAGITVTNPCDHDITVTSYFGPLGSPVLNNEDLSSVYVVAAGDTLKISATPTANRIVIEELGFEDTFELVDDDARHEVIIPVAACLTP